MRQLLNTLFVTSEDIYLSLDGENVVANRGGETVARYPLHTLQSIVTFSYAGASPALMGKCAQREIGLTFCSQRGKFLARVSGQMQGNVLLRRMQYHVADDPPQSCRIARNMIFGKVYNARWSVERTRRDHAPRVDGQRFSAVSQQLQGLLPQIAAETSPDSLRGLEGIGAAAYFSVLDEMILQGKETFFFRERSRRPPLDAFNAMLSFAYSLLAHDCASALESVGLDAYVGYLHTDRPGRESLALDLMENCSRFVLENCKISNESMAQLREDYRDKTKVVWRVPYGGGSCMTDCEVIRCTYELTDKNAQNLVYCEDVRFMDVGHNDVTFLSDFSFLKGMPKLEAIIISSAYVSDLTPFANCKELKFFEAAFCGNIEDLTPLAQCEKLEMVNISFTKVKDLSPLDNLPIKTLFAQNYSAKRISAEEQKRFAEVHPDCLTQYTGDQPYGRGWRYDEHDKYLPYYGMLRKVFRLDDNIIPNSVGWYLREGDTDLPTAES